MRNIPGFVDENISLLLSILGLLFTDKYLTKQDIALFFDVLKRRKTNPDQFDTTTAEGRANHMLATFHNETIETVIAQFKQVLKEAGYPEEELETV